MSVSVSEQGKFVWDPFCKPLRCTVTVTLTMCMHVRTSACVKRLRLQISHICMSETDTVTDAVAQNNVSVNTSDPELDIIW